MAYYWTLKPFRREMNGQSVIIPVGHRIHIALRDEAQAGLSAGALSREKPPAPKKADPNDPSTDPQRRAKSTHLTDDERAAIPVLAEALGMPKEGARAQLLKYRKKGLSVDGAVYAARKAGGVLTDEEVAEAFLDEMEQAEGVSREEAETALYAFSKNAGVNVARSAEFVRLATVCGKPAEDLFEDFTRLTAGGSMTTREAWKTLVDANPRPVEAGGEDDGQDNDEEQEIKPGVPVIVETEQGPKTGEVVTVTKSGKVRVKMPDDDAAYREFDEALVHPLGKDEVY